MANSKHKPMLRRSASINVASLRRPRSANSCRLTLGESQSGLHPSSTNKGSHSSVQFSSDNISDCREILKRQYNDKNVSSERIWLSLKAMPRSCSQEDSVATPAGRMTSHCENRELSIINDLSSSRTARVNCGREMKTLLCSTSQPSVAQTNKLVISQTSPDVFKTNKIRGIPDVSRCSQRRCSVGRMDLSQDSKFTHERTGPKSILKNANVQGREDLEKVKQFGTVSVVLSRSPGSYAASAQKLSSDTTSSDTGHVASTLPLSDKDILKRCHYRLGSWPIAPVEVSQKKVTFKYEDGLFVP